MPDCGCTKHLDTLANIYVAANRRAEVRSTLTQAQEATPSGDFKFQARFLLTRDKIERMLE